MYSFQEIYPFETFLKDRAEYFAFASFLLSDKWYDPLNKKEIGKFKEEANVEQKLDIVGLSLKM